MTVKRFISSTVLPALLLLCFLPASADARLSIQSWTEGELGAEVIVRKGERREQDIVVVWGNVKIEGELDGDIEVTFGKLDISGRVDGDVTQVGGKLTISGIVNGDVEAVSAEVEFTDGARIEGRFTNIISSEERTGDVTIRSHQHVSRPDVNVGFPFIGWNIGMGFLGLILLVLSAGVFPARVEQMAGYLDMPGRWLAAPFVGLAALVAMLLITTALCATVVGALLVPFLFLAFWITGYFGIAAFYLVIGRRLLSYLKSGGPRSLLAPIVVAYLLFRFFGLIPCIGPVVFLLGQLLSLFGVGLAVMAAFGQRGGWSTVGTVKVVTVRDGQSVPPLVREDLEEDGEADYEDEDEEYEEDDGDEKD